MSSNQTPIRNRIIHISDSHVWSSEAWARSSVIQRIKSGVMRASDNKGFLNTYQRKSELETICLSIASQCSPSNDVILITGDIVEGNFIEPAINREYRQAEQALKPLIDSGFDIHVVPGNHDMGGFGNTFRPKARERFMEFVNRVARYNGSSYSTTFPHTFEYISGARTQRKLWRLLLIDTAAHEGRGEYLARGKFGDNQLSIIRSRLNESASSASPLIIAFHHHPDMRTILGQTVLPIVDHQKFKNLLRMNQYNHFTKMICCGHKHRENLRLWVDHDRKMYAAAAGQCTSDARAICFNPQKVWETEVWRPYTMNVRYITTSPGIEVLPDSQIRKIQFRDNAIGSKIITINRRSMNPACIIEDVNLERVDLQGRQIEIGKLIETERTRWLKRSVGASLQSFNRGSPDLTVRIRVWNDRPAQLPNFRYRVLYYVRRSNTSVTCQV